MKSDNEADVNSGENLYPWRYKPGESGNPRGRPRLSAAERAARKEQKRLAREIALRELDFVILTRQHAELAVSVLAKILKSTKADDMVKLKAVGELFDRSFGKPTETTLAVTARAAVGSAETEDEREALRRVLARAGVNTAALGAPGRTIEGEASSG